MAVGAVIATVMVVLVVIEPNILEAPFENERTLLFTFGGTVVAAAAFGVMLWFRVPAPVRIVVLVVPFALVNWWLISPYFIDEMVDEEFSTSIAAQLAADPTTSAPAAQAAPGRDAVPTTEPLLAPPPVEPASEEATSTDDALRREPQASGDARPTDDAPIVEQAPAVQPPAATEPPEPTAAPAVSGPVLLGAGQFVGLAGHDGSGDAGIFQNPDGSLVVRFENFDIENGPDLEVYLVPGAGQVSLAQGSIHLGALKGNIGDQNYELPAGTVLAPGPHTVLVWCEAFSVEFVGATVSV